MRRHLFVAAAILSGLLPVAAHAQQPLAPDAELSRQFVAGEWIWVTAADGTQIDGRAGALTPSSLSVETRRGPVEVPLADVVRIRQPHDDSWWNGAIIGAVAAVAYPAWFCSQSYESGETCGENVEGLLLTASAGAAIGVLIDWAVKGKRTIYERTARRAAVRVSPAVSPRAVALRISWRIGA